jgi:HSP20 family protein
VAIPDFLDPFSMLRRLLMPVGTPGITQSAIGPVPAWLPSIEVEERDGKFIVTADLPGLDETDANVLVDGQNLIIEGERNIVREREEGNTRRTERQYGRFYRTIPLPDGVDLDSGQAQMRNGVLEVSFPMTAQGTDRRRITVRAGQREEGQKEQKTTRSEAPSDETRRAA